MRTAEKKFKHQKTGFVSRLLSTLLVLSSGSKSMKARSIPNTWNEEMELALLTQMDNQVTDKPSPEDKLKSTQVPLK